MVPLEPELLPLDDDAEDDDAELALLEPDDELLLEDDDDDTPELLALDELEDALLPLVPVDALAELAALLEPALDADDALLLEVSRSVGQRRASWPASTQ